MGKLASSERSGGDGGGDPPDRLAGAALPPTAHPRPPPATTPRTPVAGSHPAPRARPHLAGERSAGAQLRAGASRRPGCSFQDRLLRDFYSTAVPGAVAPSSPVPLWATPGSSSVRYNLAFVTNMLNYLLTVCPGRLSVSRVRPKVFRFVVANRNIAHVLAVRGWLCLGTSVLYLHASMEGAVRAAAKVEDERGSPNAAVKAHRSAAPDGTPAMPTSPFHQPILRLHQQQTQPRRAQTHHLSRLTHPTTLLGRQSIC
jgi:hypothetical protein